MTRIKRLRVPAPTPIYEPLSGYTTHHRGIGATGIFAGAGGSSVGAIGSAWGDKLWEKLDRVQVLGNEFQGHEGCVNALSWSIDGSTLLSGSDDKRICIWTADSSSEASTSSASPHPLRLTETIATGHRANIFSARFLPNAGTPTIVSVAGDRDVRVLEVERLGRAPPGWTNDRRPNSWFHRSGGGSRATLPPQRDELWGFEGPGVTVLKCHTDRAKKIATENSPSLFLTVSEDGTVRQHDLRRPHRCRTECPEPLFHAGVDLYSLSVSPVTPHIFAVAGKTDAAFICDRRMPERQTPSWGSHTRASGQVHCVRRLGLSEDEWKSISGPNSNSMFAGERHITCVKMSPDHADEVICAFAQHSTSLFSINDSSGTSNIRSSSTSSILKPNRSPSAARHNSLPSGKEEGEGRLGQTSSPSPLAGREGDENRLRDGHMKRRISQLSTANVDTTASGDSDSSNVRPRVEISASLERNGDDKVETLRPEGDPIPADTGIPIPLSSPTATPGMEILDDGELQALASDIVASYREASRPPPVGLSTRLEPGLGPELGPSPILVAPSGARRRSERGGDGPRRISITREMLRHRLGPLDGFDDEADREDENENVEDDMRELAMEEDEVLGDEDDGEIDFDEFEDLDEDDDDDFDDETRIFENRWACRSSEGEFGGVELVLPRRMFKGARNYETVKDCNFLGFNSDKVCSGSDDGNFFVWDKDTGRLVGIWEGDGTVVNVVEQHPTLPLLACSGIDETVKIFAPTSTPPQPSFSRLHLADSILQANAGPPQHSSFGGISLLDLINSGELVAERGSVPGCQTQ